MERAVPPMRQNRRYQTNELSITKDEAERAVFEAARGAVGLDDDAILVSRDVASMSPYRADRPWRELAKELAIAERELLMLARNENVLGPSELAAEAAAVAVREAHLYPDGSAKMLREKLADIHGVTPEHIVVGNGSNEIMELLVRTFVGAGETVVTSWPSFVVYRLVAQAHGREALIAPLRNDRYDLSALSALVDRRTKIVFIANPNNPTGTYVPKRHLAAFLERIPRSVIVVLDEAYHEFARADDYPNGVKDFLFYPRLVVLRTFSKVYGLAGMRIGYGIMEPTLVRYINAIRQPHNVNHVGQTAALAALDDVQHVRKSCRMVWEGLDEIETKVTRLGLTPIKSQANFTCVQCPFPVSDLVSELQHRGILVGDLRGYDMPNAFRVTVGTKEMRLMFFSALEELVPKYLPPGQTTSS